MNSLKLLSPISKTVIFIILQFATVVILPAQKSPQTFKNYNELDTIFSNARIVLIGEPTHFSYEAMYERVELIKYLHDSMGYNILAFESSLYDMRKTTELIEEGTPFSKAIQKGIFDIWRGSGPIDSLSAYCDQLNIPLQLAGFDNQICSGHFTQDGLTEDLKTFCSKEAIGVPAYFFGLLDEEIQSFCTDYRPSASLNDLLLKQILGLIEQIQQIDNQEARFWEQNLVSIHGQLYDFYFNEIHKKSAETFRPADSNVRDSLMAQNLLYLAENYPDEKIIGWGASYHFSNDVTKLQINNESLADARPMGYYLKPALGDRCILIGIADQSQLPDSIYRNSIEYTSHSLFNGEKKLLNMRSPRRLEGYSGVLGTDEATGEYPKGNWNNVLDYSIIIDSKQKYKRAGRLVDAESKKGIPFAHIRVKGRSIGTVSNEQGAFELVIPEQLKDEPIQFSLVGYEPYDIPFLQIKDEIDLIPNTAYLKEVTVSAERIDNVAMLIEVAQSYVESTYKEAYELRAYYKSDFALEEVPQDTLTTEAAVIFYNENCFEKDRILVSNIVNKRELRKIRSDLQVPWPVHAYGVAEFNYNRGLLHNKAEKLCQVDSMTITINNDDTLVTLNYQFEKPTYGWIGTSCTSHTGILQFLENSQNIVSHTSQYTFDGNNGLRKATYRIEYMTFNGYQFPKLITMIYESIDENDQIVYGKDLIMVNEVKLKEVKKPENPTIFIKEAPYDKSFWENYNYVKIE